MIKFRVLGGDDTAQALRNDIRDIERETERTLRRLGTYTEGRAKAYTMDAGAVDLGELLSGIHYEYTRGAREQQVTVKPSTDADEYAVYVERGTRPHTPPASALQGWADRHGIPVWAVVRKISLYGTEPRHMWRDTFNDLLLRAESATRTLANNINRGL